MHTTVDLHVGNQLQPVAADCGKALVKQSKTKKTTPADEPHNRLCGSSEFLQRICRNAVGGEGASAGTNPHWASWTAKHPGQWVDAAGAARRRRSPSLLAELDQSLV